MTDNKTRCKTRPFPKKDPSVIYALALDRLRNQQEQVSSLEGKIANLLGFSSTLIAIMAALLAFKGNGIPDHVIRLFITAGVIYVIIAVCSLVGYYTRKWQVGPLLNEAWEYIRKYPQKSMGWWVAESLTKCYENNQSGVKLKVRIVKANVVLLIVQAILIALGLSLMFVI